MEVAALLGAFPTALTVLEIFSSLANVQPRYSILRTQIKDAYHMLESEACRLRSTFEVLLYNALPPDEVQQLLQDSRSPRWESPEIEAAFRRTLGNTGYDEFVQSLRNSVETLSALQASISRITPITDITPDSRRLRQQVLWVLRRDKFARDMEELRQHIQSVDSYVHIGAVNRSFQARRNLDDALKAITGVAAMTCQAVEVVSANGKGDPSLLENEDAMSVMTDDNEPVPLEPEPGPDGARLRYLDVTIQSTKSSKRASASSWRAHRLPEKALLDSGATHCVISVALAHKLKIKIPDDADLREVHTLIPSDNPPKCWQAKVNLRWKDRKRNRYRTKIDVHVVLEEHPGQHIILSQEFMNNHKEVWDAATLTSETKMRAQFTWLRKFRPKHKKKQAERLEEIEKKNRVRIEAESSKRQKAKLKPGPQNASNADPSAPASPDPGLPSSSGAPPPKSN